MARADISRAGGECNHDASLIGVLRIGIGNGTLGRAFFLPIRSFGQKVD